jgi:hypothetical protein
VKSPKAMAAADRNVVVVDNPFQLVQVLCNNLGREGKKTERVL